MTVLRRCLFRSVVAHACIPVNLNIYVSFLLLLVVSGGALSATTPLISEMLKLFVINWGTTRQLTCKSVETHSTVNGEGKYGWTTYPVADASVGWSPVPIVRSGCTTAITLRTWVCFAVKDRL